MSRFGVIVLTLLPWLATWLVVYLGEGSSRRDFKEISDRPHSESDGLNLFASQEEAPAQPTKTHELSPLDHGRADSLRHWHAFLEDDTILKGFRRQAIVENVCAPLETHEERQMCRRRGRRMGNTLEKYFGEGKPLSRARGDRAAQQFMKEAWEKSFHPPRTAVVRFTVVDGKLVDWMQLKKKKRAIVTYYEHWAVNFFLLFEKEIFSPGQSFDFFIDMADACYNREDPPYPIVSFSTSEASCPSNIPMNYAVWCQGGGNMLRTPQPFEKLKPQILSTGTCGQPHRLVAPAYSTSGAIPQLKSKCHDAGRNWNRRCMKMLRRASANNSASLTKLWGDSNRLCESIVTQDFVSLDDALENKYLLIVDGHSTTFRLASQLQTNPVLLQWNPTGFKQSYEYDMLPYVHYIPIRPEGYGNFGDKLQEAYDWLEKNPVVAKNISSEATRWGRLHADRASFITEWKLYAALLSDMQEQGATTAYRAAAASMPPINPSFSLDDNRTHNPDEYYVLRINGKRFPR